MSPKMSRSSFDRMIYTRKRFAERDHAHRSRPRRTFSRLPAAPDRSGYSVSSRPAISAARRARCPHRMCSWLACAPAPGQPSPSSVGTPSAAEKLPSDPPPRCCFGSASPTCRAIALRLVVQAPDIAGLSGIGRPVHAALDDHPAAGGLRASAPAAAPPSAPRPRRSSRAGRSRTRHPARSRSAASRPRSGAAFSVMPRSISTIRCRPMIWCDSSTIAEAPSSNAPPECAPRPSTRITKRPTPLRAVTQAPPAPAGSGISTEAAWAASCSISQRLVGLPTSSSGVSSSTIGRWSRSSGSGCSAPHGMPGNCRPSCRRCPGRAPSSPFTLYGIESSVPCDQTVSRWPGDQDRLAPSAPGAIACERPGCRRSRPGRGCG